MIALSSEELVNLTGEHLLYRMDELRHAAALAGCKWAELQKSYHDLKTLMPSYLATIQNCFMTGGDTVTVAKVKALASSTYQNHLRAMNQAELEAELLYVEFKGLSKSLEVLQSIAFVRNQEMKLAR